MEPDPQNMQKATITAAMPARESCTAYSKSISATPFQP